MTHKAKTVDIIPAEFLLSAYAGGYFPMSESGSESVRWYYPDPATIIPLGSWKIARSLKLFMKKCDWRVTSDRDFTAVIQSCSRRLNTWISDTIKRSYINLHREGYAHSVEVRENDRLIGGLYGVTLGSAFFGESMFRLKDNASKVALTALLHYLNDAGFTLLDVQMMTPVMEQFGAKSMTRDNYLNLLHAALDNETPLFPLIDLKTSQILEICKK